MKDIFRSHLFEKHILVGEASDSPDIEECFSVLCALGNKFGIRVEGDIRLLNRNMIYDASRNLGIYVPEAFYRGFPNSVRALTHTELLFDQLLHYASMIGFEVFDGSRKHSVFEERLERVAFNEKTETKTFRLVDEKEALGMVKKDAISMLQMNSRPLNYDDALLVFEAYKEFGEQIVPNGIQCKQTAIEFLYKTRNPIFINCLKLPDVIKLLAYIQYNCYGSEKLNRLNLRNQDRKLITKVVDQLTEKASDKEFKECCEKRKTWKGLLHHIHYEPKGEQARRFVDDMIYAKENHSVYSRFEELMSKGERVKAAEVLCYEKGSGDLIRHLNYILSRCETDEEIWEVLKHVN